MKTEELMIGDWVRVPSELNREKQIRSTFDMDSAVLYEAIPLTPEILEKNGFKKYNGLYRLDIAEGVFVNADFKSKEPFVSVHNTCYRATPICWYLHQLQHALRLCGIEKEIEL